MIDTLHSFSTNGARKAIRSFRTAIEKVDSGLKLHHYKVRNFTGNVAFAFDKGSFLVKTAENGSELEDCLRLRFNVFHKEYMRKSREIGVDVDWLDFTCDHLMIVDKRTGKTIGTYRLNSSLFSDSFYSQGEFEIANIIKLPGTKLELGRACIDREFRTGAVIALLWRGIAEYIRQTKTEILFGCSSIKTIEPMEIARVTRRLIHSGEITFEHGVQPTKKYRVKQLAHILKYLDEQNESPDTEGLAIPPLFLSYLRMGAKLCGEPAIDREFHCIDFLTLIRTAELSPAIREKYGI